MILPRSESAARSLAYEQAIARAPKPVSEPKESKPAESAIPPFETKSTPEPEAAQDITSAAPSGEQDQPEVMGAMPQGDTGTPQEVPPPPGGDPYVDMPPLPGEQSEAYDNVPPMPGESGDNYGVYDETAPMPGEPTDGGEPRYGNEPGADPWGQEAGANPAESGEEWVQVVISGAAMRASAAEDAAMLFAFPYGRRLRVVSRFEGWLEVTDPQSSATGWMQTHFVAPASSFSPSYGQDQTAYEEPRERRGLFRRGGFADMIQRAFGGQ